MTKRVQDHDDDDDANLSRNSLYHRGKSSSERLATKNRLNPDSVLQRRRERRRASEVMKSQSTITSISHVDHHLTKTLGEVEDRKPRRHSSYNLGTFISATTTTSSHIRPAYVPPSVKYQQRKKEQLRRRRDTNSSMLDGISVSSSQSPSHATTDTSVTGDDVMSAFCPIQAARICLHREMDALLTQSPNSKVVGAGPHMSFEDLQLSLSIWDAISPKRHTTKVEVQVVTIASTTGLSHLRLTRFLKGDRDRSLRGSEIARTAQTLKSWLEDVERDEKTE